ncbi:hypothetical protein ACLKA6_009877 [Drosophila palustris]
MAANQDAGVDLHSKSNLAKKRADESKMDDMECENENENENESIEFSFAHFEQHWRLYLINFERQRLQYAGICCGHKEVLYGLDVGLLAEDMQPIINFEDSVKAAASSLYELPYNNNINNNNMNSNHCMAPSESRGSKATSTHPAEDSCNLLGHSH